MFHVKQFPASMRGRISLWLYAKQKKGGMFHVKQGRLSKKCTKTEENGKKH
jgi:hypothetical protein